LTSQASWQKLKVSTSNELGEIELRLQRLEDQIENEIQRLKAKPKQP